MATRSRIGIELIDGTVLSVYCHWDGYPEHHGKILFKHYTKREDVMDLIDGGAISSLRTRETWESNCSMLRDEDGEYIRDEEGYFRYKNDREPQPLYYAERGEQIDIEKTTFESFVSGNLGGEEYFYLLTLNNEWKVYALGSTEPLELSQECATVPF